MRNTVTLAQLSDLHLAPLPGLPLRHANAKRLLGLANWRRNRQRLHLRPVLDAIVADVLAQHPDHIAVTGDLVNLGLPAEHEAARRWLEQLGPPGRVSVVPGNHDAYVRMRDPGYLRWAGYMTGVGENPGVGAPHAPPGGDPRGAFPYVRQVGGVALIGLASGVPTPLLLSSGELGPAQLQRFAVALRHTKAGFTRVVLIHHPPLPHPAAWRRGLRDAAGFGRVIATEGAELVLHGHFHRHMLNWLPGRPLPTEWRAGHRALPGETAREQVPVVGVASASAGNVSHGDLAAYHLFHITTAGPAAGIEMVVRGLASPASPVRELSRTLLTSFAPLTAASAAR